MKRAITNKFTNKTIPVLECVAVTNGRGFCSSLDASLSFPIDLPDGVYSKEEIQIGFRVRDAGYNAEDISSIKIGDKNGDPFNVSCADLEWVSRAVSKEYTRYYLNGVYFDNGLMVATDGHRMFMCQVTEMIGKIILPTDTIKGVLALAKALKKKVVTITAHNSGFEIQVGDCSIVSKAVDGNYPDYARVIPDHKNKTQINISSVRKATKIVPLVNYADMNSGYVCRMGGGKILAYRSDKWNCDTEFNPKDGVVFGANIKYLESIGMDAEVFYGGNEDPLKFVNENRTAVLMPCRV